MNLSDYLWIPVLLAVFAIVPAVVIAIKRIFVAIFKKITGKDKVEAAQREALRAEYLNPEWPALTAYLQREPPRYFKQLHDSGLLVDNPIVSVDGEEFWLYSVHDGGLTKVGIWPLGQNELGEPLFLKPGENDNALYLHELGPEIRELASDANAFFRRVLEQNFRAE